MGSRVALVTGAAGEMGNRLLPSLRERGWSVVAVDLAPLDPSLAAACTETVEASVLDGAVLEALFDRVRPSTVFHLAATLSSKGESDPDLAHRVNVDATVDLLRLARRAAAVSGRDVRFLFPSSIAVYGLPDAATKAAAGAVREEEWIRPTSVYGCNKVYCEMLGTYFSRRASAEGRPGVDFRSIRFPGLISADTLPSGGTSDYAPEMIHAAARGMEYACFVGEATRIPFMTMPDAIDAFLALAEVDAAALTTRVYNVRAFSPSAGEIRDAVVGCFPDARITFEPVAFRQAIVDSWPADIDDGRARHDWGHRPSHGLPEALRDYLVPALLRRYRAGATR